MAIAASKKDLVQRWRSDKGPELRESALQAFRKSDPKALELIGASWPQTPDVEGYVDLRGLELSGEVFGMDLTKVDLSYAAVPKGAVDRFILFKRCRLIDARLRDIRSELGIEVSDARSADFSGSNLRKNDFVRCDVRRARFDRADLRSANFYRLDLQDCTFVEANLAHAMLSGANCAGADFSGANLDSANLEDIVVSDATRLSASVAASFRQGAMPLTQREIEEISRAVVEAALSDMPSDAEFRTFLESVRNDFGRGQAVDVLARIDRTFQEPERARLLEVLSVAARSM